MAMMANTMDAAPRRPAQETSNFCRVLHRNGERMENTAAGLATKVRNNAIRIAGNKMAGILEGKDNRPSRKKMSICIKPVTPSKKCTNARLFKILLLPITIPTN